MRACAREAGRGTAIRGTTIEIALNVYWKGDEGIDGPGLWSTPVEPCWYSRAGWLRRCLAETARSRV